MPSSLHISLQYHGAALGPDSLAAVDPWQGPESAQDDTMELIRLQHEIYSFVAQKNVSY